MSSEPESPIQSITPEERRSGFWRSLKRLFRVGIATVLFALILGWLFVLFPVEKRVFKAALTQPLVNFRKTDDQLQFISCICGSTLRPDEVPDSVANALIATEDRRFYQHFGIDFLSFGKAVLSGGNRGGSTLEMQLAKNTLNGASPSALRKYAELFFATRISLSYKKKDILRLYLSRVNFGRLNGVPIFGLRDAAYAYFNVAPERLNVAQAAILVGMINAPSLYNPINNPKSSTQRAALVLRRMETEGFVDNAEAVKLSAALPRSIGRLPRRDRYLEDQVMRELRDLAEPLPDGLHFAITTIDPIAQEQARRVVARNIQGYRNQGVARAGLISVDSKGRVLAMLGGLDYRASNWNLAMQAERQAASTAKIATYVAAIESGWGPDATLKDNPDDIEADFVPRNVDRRYVGDIPLRDCISQSRNVCTMWLAEQVGFDAVAEVAERIGITQTRMPGSAIVLGAAETTLARNAGAYLAVSNGGEHYEPHVLRAVLGQYGKVLYRDSTAPERVMTLVTAERMKQLLGGVTADGATGDTAQFEGGRAYGKTGTSQENRDAWFVGFTDQGIVTAVWVGPPEGRLMRNVAGGQLPAEIFSDYNVNLVERFQGYVGQLPYDPASFWRDVNVP